MASRKRRTVPQEYTGGLGLIRPRRKAAAEPNISTLPIEGMSPILDPNRALLRRVLFLNEDRNKYICGILPATGIFSFGRTWGS
jgi:hypothetical protein